MNYQNYMNMNAVNKLLRTRSSNRVRKEFKSYLSLMMTDKGTIRQMLGTTTKTDKRLEGVPVKVSILNFAPAKIAGFGINTCRYAGSCKDNCLFASGNLPRHHESYVAKTRAFWGYPVEFLTELIKDISREAFAAHLDGDALYIRLNGTSDISWEDYLDLNALTRDIDGLAGFYDYTKAPLTVRTPTDSYHLTFSVDEKNVALSRAREYRDAGYPFAVVSPNEDYKLLKKLDGVTDGDESDFRFFDTGLVILKAKTLTNFSKKGRKDVYKGEYGEVGKGLVRSLRQVLELVLT